MTAIAYRDGILAADTQTSAGELRVGSCNKIARSPSGTIGAASGYAGDTDHFRRWLTQGAADKWLGDVDAGSYDTAPFNGDHGDFGAILIEKTGRVTRIDSKGTIIHIEAPFYVEGSASEVCFGAMAAGATAIRAVQLAIKYAIGSGGIVTWDTIK